MRVVTRSWATPDAREPKPSVSPGQWTEDLRGTGLLHATPGRHTRNGSRSQYLQAALSVKNL